MDNLVVILQYIALPIITILVTHFLNRRKMHTEIRKMELESSIALDDAKTEKLKSGAETDRYVSDTVMGLVERLSDRLEVVEKRYDETRKKVEDERIEHTKESDLLNIEIRLMKEQLERAIAERKTAEARLSASLDLARRYRLIASDLYHQLLEESIVPRHVLEVCDELDAEML